MMMEEAAANISGPFDKSLPALGGPISISMEEINCHEVAAGVGDEPRAGFAVCSTCVHVTTDDQRMKSKWYCVGRNRQNGQKIVLAQQQQTTPVRNFHNGAAHTRNGQRNMNGLSPEKEMFLTGNVAHREHCSSNVASLSYSRAPIASSYLFDIHQRREMMEPIQGAGDSGIYGKNTTPRSFPYSEVSRKDQVLTSISPVPLRGCYSLSPKKESQRSWRTLHECTSTTFERDITNPHEISKGIPDNGTNAKVYLSPHDVEAVAGLMSVGTSSMHNGQEFQNDMGHEVIDCNIQCDRATSRTHSTESCSDSDMTDELQYDSSTFSADSSECQGFDYGCGCPRCQDYEEHMNHKLLLIQRCQKDSLKLTETSPESDERSTDASTCSNFNPWPLIKMIIAQDNIPPKLQQRVIQRVCELQQYTKKNEAKTTDRAPAPSSFIIHEIVRKGELGWGWYQDQLLRKCNRQCNEQKQQKEQRFVPRQVVMRGQQTQRERVKELPRVPEWAQYLADCHTNPGNKPTHFHVSPKVHHQISLLLQTKLQTRKKRFHNHDVICGRGQEIRNKPGNINYRSLIISLKPEHYCLSKIERRTMAAYVVNAIRDLTPPGRFLEIIGNGDTEVWKDVGDEKALNKTRQLFREGSIEIRKKLKSGELYVEPFCNWRALIDLKIRTVYGNERPMHYQHTFCG